jgi:hypothetical protein
LSVSFFDPMPVEIAIGFVLLGICEFPQVFGLAMGNTVSLGG